MPGSKNVHVNRPLTNVSVAFFQEEMSFIAHRAFAEIPSRHKSNQYRVYDKGTFFRDEAKKRGPCQPSAGGTHGTTLDDFKCDVYAYHEDICWQDKADADDGVDLDREATIIVSQKMMIKRERTWMSDYFKASVWSGDVTVTTAWSDSSATPIADLRAEIIDMKLTTGFKPNVLVLDLTTWGDIADHPDFLGRISGGATQAQPAIVMKQLLAQILELDEVLVSEAAYDSANEGATESIGAIAPRGALLLHRPRSPGLYVPAAGYTFNWTGYLGGQAGGNGQIITRFDMQELKATRVEGEIAYDQKLVSADLGRWFTNV